MYGFADVLHGTVKHSEVVENYDKTKKWVPYPNKNKDD